MPDNRSVTVAAPIRAARVSKRSSQEPNLAVRDLGRVAEHPRAIEIASGGNCERCG